MQKDVSLKLLPSEASSTEIIRAYTAKAVGKKNTEVTGFYITQKSIDARGKQPWINLTVHAFINEPVIDRPVKKIDLQDISRATHTVIIIGAGPAGLFAALKCIELGVKPVILERGKDVRARRRDLAVLNKEGIVNEESNYCFGEGGAGTYSDGKLYTRSTKRGDIHRILNILVQFGADEKILYESHPHIGTNKLPHIITAMREQVIASGGEVLFEHKLTDIIVDNGNIRYVIVNNATKMPAEAVILATGHSAGDIFELLHSKNITVEAKPFALGVRVEHPQALIDGIQYHCSAAPDGCVRDEHLPPASYSLVEQVNGKGVFSFCMCPGGIIAPAATRQGKLVVNGWSPSKRNNPYANSGMVVTVEQKDLAGIKGFSISDKKLNSPLALLHFQSWVEENAFNAGEGKFVAPAQRMVDFCDNKISSSLPPCSYVPGITSAHLNTVLPQFIFQSLQQGFKAFGKKMRGYYTNEANIVATESRTSSPVRIPRDSVTLQHPQIHNLYPCGEGAGYAGGIVSAAMDGERVAAIIAEKFIP
ncbi:MAG TPA: FAD-binding protein [Chitinophagaceae bacterium]|nr:FAD-binding protein [Chitinophagaceae bacterium]